MANSSGFFENVENIVPLREGRLGNVVNQGMLEPAKIRKESEAAKRRLEREKETQDPLGAYVSYISTLRSIYPSGNKAVDDALCEAANIFHDVPEYKNDSRLLDIFLRIADKQQDPREVFDYMISNQIAQNLPRFHLAMGAVYERAKDYKTAENAYSQAVSVAKSQSSEDFKLATVHLTHFKRRMARLLQDSRAIHGPSSPSMRARVGLLHQQAPPLSQRQQPQKSVIQSQARTTAKRPQFQVFSDEDAENNANSSVARSNRGQPPVSKWDRLEPESHAVENQAMPPKPWNEVGTLPQRVPTSVRQPSFKVYEGPSSLARPARPQQHQPAFTVYADPEDEETKQKPIEDERKGKIVVWKDDEDELSTRMQSSMTLTSPASSNKDNDPDVGSHASKDAEPRHLANEMTPRATLDRADQTLHTKRALDDLFEMFGSPSMSAIRTTQRPPNTSNRPMMTPAMWPANRLAEAALETRRNAPRTAARNPATAGQGLQQQGNAEMEDEFADERQNISPNAGMPTTVRRRRPVPLSARPVLAVIEDHEANASPDFLRMARNPPRPEEDFVVAGNYSEGQSQARENLPGDNDTFGISSVLAFGQQRGNQPMSSTRNNNHLSFSVYRD